MKRAVVLFLVLVFSASLSACTTSQDVNSAYKDGYFDALEKYEQEIDSLKEEISLLETEKASLSELSDEQYSLGYECGFHDGFRSGIDKEYSIAFNDGYSTGYDYCYSNGYSTSTQAGKNPWELYIEKQDGNPFSPYSSTVYTQSSDTRYHTEDCQELTGTKVSMPELTAIEKGYSPCIHCNP